MNQSTPETPSLAEAFHALCKARGLPVVSGTVNNFSAGVTAITFSADAIRGPDVDAVIDLAAPKMGVVELSTETGRLITRAWMLGGPMALCWDDSDEAGGDGDDEADDARLAALGRQLAQLGAFQLASSTAARKLAADAWLHDRGEVLDADSAKEVARVAAVVVDYEILPVKIAARVADGSTASDIAKQFNLSPAKAKRLVEQVRNA